MPPLLLASGSPRRAQLLSEAGVDHTVMPVNVDESWHEGEAPIHYAKRLAAAKVEAAATRKGGALVLGADTVVWTSPKEPPIGKPRDRDSAWRMLQRLTGSSETPHFVTTAWAILDGRKEPSDLRVHHETTRVWMRNLRPEEIDQYLELGEWKDKAGGYAIQGRAGSFVTRVEGSYTGVVGLPVAQVVELLQVLEAEEPPSR